MTPRQTWAPAPAPRCALNSKTDPLNHSGNLMKRNLITIALFAALSTSAMATGLNFGNTTNNDNSVTNKGGEGGKGGSAIAGAVAAAKASVNSKNTASASSGGNTQSVSVQGDAASRMPASTAYSAALAASNGTCLGSASGGIQGMGAGVSFGSTKLDTGCDTRYDVQTLQSMGLHTAAVARACQKPELAEAMGSLCPSKTAQTESAPVAGYTGNDPIVKARLGLAN